MTDHEAEARRLFHSGANCAQAVLGAFRDECHLDMETALRLGSSFGGGIARLREVCGAVSGMCMAAGVLWGYDDLTDKAAKDAHYALTQELAARFKRDTGSLICRELLGLARGEGESPVSEARTAVYYNKRPCVEMVTLAARILEQELRHRTEGHDHDPGK